LLLVCSALLFLKFLELSIRYPYQAALTTALFFLFMLLQSLINLVVMAKTFPDKILTGAKNSWHILAILLNAVSIAGMIYGFFSLLSEMSDFPGEKALIILLLITIVFMLSLLFVFFCQLTLKRYLRRTNTDLIDSMINSIGSDELKHD
jgi:hypothetical protein